jgi:dipeptidyl aminopeptidase/acylaminoacyl peptidase
LIVSVPETAPYGSWKSPISAGQIASAALKLSHVEIKNGKIYWNELRPAEAGRCVIVCFDSEGTSDVTPSPFNVRTRVHEYGGGAYTIAGKNIYYSNFTDQRLYRVKGPGPPVPVTGESDMRYADGIWDAGRKRIICVREDHTGDGEAVNTIAAIDPKQDSCGEVLVSGNDFYSSPRLSPDGKELAWLTWNHPNMPWDSAELWTAPVNKDGSIGTAEHIAGGKNESICQPEWSPKGELYFVSDRTNWWNLYRVRSEKIEPVILMEAEFALPHWVFHMSTYSFAGADRIVCAYCRRGMWNLAVVDIASGILHRLETPYNSIMDLSAEDGTVAFIGGSATEPVSVIKLDLESGETQTLRCSTSLQIPLELVSHPEPIEFSTEHNLKAHAIYYPPVNPGFTPPVDEKPPLLVMIHGGPTAAATASLKLGIQYYTNRGIAVLDVNYGGSTGYGRAYRQRLYGSWGIVDVDDCVNGALYLAEQGLVDKDRMAITGGSAGGYTTLSALAFRDVFAAGSSHYGVSDCEALAWETHKFESHYLDTLIGLYPEQRELYIKRSPINHVNQLSCPIIFFQGDEDKIVPPDQAEKMVDALREKGVPVAYILFEGEQHGFRKSENIQRSLEAELYFLSRIFKFDLADPVDPVTIENLRVIP